MPFQTNLGNEASCISLQKILCFIKMGWQTIVTAGVIGLVISIMFLWLTSVKYETTAIISVGQFYDHKDQKIITLHDPATLIFRMKQAGAFNSLNWGDCMSKSLGRNIQEVDDVIKINKTSDIVLEIQGSAPNQAKICANNIFNMVNIFEQNLVIEWQEKNNSEILGLQKKLDVYSLILNSKKSSDGDRLVALEGATRVEDKLQLARKVASSIASFSSAKFSQPATEIRKPGHFRMLIGLIGGLLGGVSIGILFLCSKYLISRIKQNLRGNL